MKITIIIPTFNEIKNGYIQKILPLLSEIKNIEVIVVDSFSKDGTIELVKKYGFRLIQIETNSRAIRLKVGIENATEEIIVLHHPRSLLSNDGLEYLKLNGEGWGAFKHQFDDNHPLLAFTSFWSNYIRGFRGIFYLDHCLYFEANLKAEVLKLPNVDIFEDTEICKILRRVSTPKLLPFPSTTSAIRFKSNGFIKQAILNQRLKMQYYLGFSHQKMNKSYEKNLKLNSKYEHPGS